MWHLYYRLSGTTDQRLARARQERSAAGSLRLPTARRASAQSRETTTTTTNCWSILRIVSSMLKRCSESVTEPSAMKGCLAYRLRREAFAYVRAPYALMDYPPVGVVAWWLRARHDRRAASYRLSDTTEQHWHAMSAAWCGLLCVAFPQHQQHIGSRAKSRNPASVTNGYSPGVTPTHPRRVYDLAPGL